MKEHLTYIQVAKETRRLLQGIKLTQRESYNEIIIRLMEERKE